MTHDAALTLANCLEAIERHELTLDEYLERHPDQLSPLVDLVPVAQRLCAAPGVRPSPDFRADARARLLAQLPPRRSHRVRISILNWARVIPSAARQDTVTIGGLRLIRVLAVLAILIVLSTSVVVASAQSLPNEVLYPVKISIEQVRLAFSPDQLTRSELSLGFAGERLSEVQRLIERDQASAATGALDAFAEQIQSAAAMAQSLPVTLERETWLAHLQGSMDQLDVELSSSERNLPESVQPAVQRAHAALRTVPPQVTPEAPPTLTPTPTPTPTSTDKPEPPTRAPRLAPSPQPGVLPTVRPTRAAPPIAPTATIHWPTFEPTRWPIGAPTRRPTPIATWHPTFVPPTWPTHPPLATPELADAAARSDTTHLADLAVDVAPHTRRGYGRRRAGNLVN